MLKCSFCDKSQTQVKKLVFKNETTSICDECVIVCLQVMLDHKQVETKNAE
jgi:ATP-dependent Clp protease ATP-binding subunit ClpX